MYKIKGLRWHIIILLTLVTTINYIDRTSLSVAGPTLKEKLNINEQQFAYIIMCFQICYLIMQPLSGRVIDYLHLKKGFTLSVIWWSVANMLHALARTPLTFGIFRALLGIGEAANFPALAKTVSEWFPPKERTIATGIANIGSGTGAMVATPLVAWIILKFGWQQAFVITGLLGFVWVFVWLLLYYPPAKHPFITPEELAIIGKKHDDFNIQEESAEKGVWKIVLRQKNFWGIGLGRFFSEPAWQFFTYWIPMYLVTQRGLNLKQIGMFAWIPFLAADLGSFIGGFLSPFYHRLGVSILTSRKLAVTTAALVMPLALLIISAPSAGWAICWFCCAAFSHNCVSATTLTLPADLFPQRTVATANGLSGCLGYLGGMLFTFSVGWLVIHAGYTPIFIMVAFLELVCAAFLWVFLRNPASKNQIQ
jgi:ACS family hexuronate transporter-like MFS transporter